MSQSNVKKHHCQQMDNSMPNTACDQPCCGQWQQNDRGKTGKEEDVNCPLWSEQISSLREGKNNGWVWLKNKSQENRPTS